MPHLANRRVHPHLQEPKTRATNMSSIILRRFVAVSLACGGFFVVGAAFAGCGQPGYPACDPTPAGHAVLDAGGAEAPTVSSDELLSAKACAEKSLARDLDSLAAVVTSEAAFRKSLKTNSRLKEDLGALSPQSRKRFISSLRFGEAGLGSYYFGDLEAELSVTQIYKLLAHFGLQSNVKHMKNARVVTDLDKSIVEMFERESRGVQMKCTVGDKDAHECLGRGTCAPNARYLCTSNC